MAHKTERDAAARLHLFERSHDGEKSVFGKFFKRGVGIVVRFIFERFPPHAILFE